MPGVLRTQNPDVCAYSNVNKDFANASPDAPNIPRILPMRGLFGASHAVAASYVWYDILNMSWVMPEHALVLTWHRRI